MADQLPFLPDQTSHTRVLLIQAGYYEYHHFILYLGMRVLAALLALGSILLIGGVTSPLWLLGVTGMGFFVPRFILKKRIRNRQERIRLGLIDTLDLTTLCIGPGVGPAMTSRKTKKHVTEDLRLEYPELHDELYFVCRDMHAGYSWDEALDAMSERTGVGEIRGLSELIRTEPLGILKILRSGADSLRVERRQHSNTIVPLIVFSAVFIVPLMVIVICGPALIQLYRGLVG